MSKKLISCIDAIEKKGLDSLLVSNPDTVSYLTDFRKADGFLLLSRKKILYFTNPIYLQEAKKITRCSVICIESDFFETICNKARRCKLKKVGFEGKHLSYLEYKKLKNFFLKARIQFTPADTILETLRVRKTAKEIALMQKAARTTLKAFDLTRHIITKNTNEKDLALHLETYLRTHADNEVAFSPIVASGKNSALPHHIPQATKVSPERPFLIDLGAKHYGYCADLTRVFFLDKMPLYFKKIYSIVKKAKELAVRKIRDGASAQDVDRAARSYIERKGYGKYFTHGLGHGIGRCVHEQPYVNQYSEVILKEGMVFTVEPAIYLPGKFGIRIEDMVVVKRHAAQVL